MTSRGRGGTSGRGGKSGRGGRSTASNAGNTSSSSVNEAAIANTQVLPATVASLTDEERELDGYEGELAAREQNIADKTTEIQTRETSIHYRLMNLNERQGAVAVREQEIRETFSSKARIEAEAALERRELQKRHEQELDKILAQKEAEIQQLKNRLNATAPGNNSKRRLVEAQDGHVVQTFNQSARTGAIIINIGFNAGRTARASRVNAMGKGKQQKEVSDESDDEDDE